MGVALVLYWLGVAFAAVCLFLSPWPYLGFAPLAVGAIWAAYDLIEVKDADGDTPTAPPTAR